MEVIVRKLNFAQRFIYWATYIVVVIFMVIFYTLKQGEGIARHHIIRYVRNWKEEIDQ